MFKKDEREEEFLKRKGVTFAWSNKLTFDMLVPGWDVINVGRPMAVDEDVVCEYADRMEHKEEAPGPILCVHSEGHTVIDGVQRLSAAKLLGCTLFSGYVVKTDSEAKADELRICANADICGHPPDTKWGFQQAVSVLILQHHLGIAEVARMMHRAKDVVQDEVTFQTYRYALSTVGAPSKLHRCLIEGIAKRIPLKMIERAPKPMAELATILTDAKITNGEAPRLLDTFFDGAEKAKDLHELLTEHVADLRADPEVKTRLEGRGRTKLKDDIALRKALKCALTCAKHLQESGQVLYADEFYQLLRQIEAVVRSIDKHTKHHAVA